MYQIPHNSIRKKMTVAVYHPKENDLVRVYVKGAPEIILPKCKSMIGTGGNVERMDQNELNYMLNEICDDKMAKQGYRTLCYAYRDMSEDEFLTLK